MNPYSLRRLVRRATYLLVAIGLGYLVWRFDQHTLPADGCSPLLRFAPGSSLLLDRFPGSYVVGDAFLFEAPDGLIYMALVERLRPASAASGAPALWAAVDNPACQGRGSEAFGWIERDACVARVVMVWPW